MSIIHDALKKIQRVTPEANQPAANAASGPVQASSLPALQENGRPSTIILVSVISVVVAVLFTILWTLAKETRALPVKPVAAEQAKPLAEAAKPLAPTSTEMGAALVAPAPKPAVDPNDVLANIHIQGILDKSGKAVALINDNVYIEGDTFHGKPITRITIDSVTIMDGEKERVFPVDPSQK